MRKSTLRFAATGILIGWAASAAVVCPNGANLVANCGFETNDTGWSLVIGDLQQRTTADSLTGVGALELFADDSGTALTRGSCVAVSPSTVYALGAYFKHDQGQAPATCKVQIRQNSDAVGVCSAFVSVSDTPLLPVNDVDWTLVNRSLTTAANAQSARLDLSCIGGNSLTTVRIDDVFLGIGLVAPLFADGFEVNGTAEWSSVAL